MQIHSPSDLDRLGDEIAELSAHLDAATARLLGLIQEFDARGGWNTGFRSCAAWLSWRAGLDLGAARERALGALLVQALAAAHETLYQWARVPDGAAGHGGVRPGASPPPLGARGSDYAVEPRASLPAPPGGARGGLPGRARARRDAPIPAGGATAG